MKGYYLNLRPYVLVNSSKQYCDSIFLIQSRARSFKAKYYTICSEEEKEFFTKCMNNFNKIETVSLTEIYMNFEPVIRCVLAGSCYGCVLRTPVSNTLSSGKKQVIGESVIATLCVYSDHHTKQDMTFVWKFLFETLWNIWNQLNM